jgi:hypothetical protein
MYASRVRLCVRVKSRESGIKICWLKANCKDRLLGWPVKGIGLAGTELE